MADVPTAILVALGQLMQAVASILRDRPPDAAARIARATMALTSRKATAETARAALKRIRK